MEQFMWAAFALILIAVLAIVAGQMYKARVTAINQRSFDEMANKLVGETEVIKAEIAEMKEIVCSINKMMKEIG